MSRLVSLPLLLLCLSLPAQQLTGHYVPGAEGIKGASLPPPGFYLRDYNIIYTACRFPDGPPNFDALVYAQVPRLIYMSDLKILGANYGLDILVPFVYTDLSAGGFSDSHFGVGDLQFEPLLLSWHWKQFDLAAGYAFWAPTGDFDVQNPTKPGKGFWSNMFTVGAVWYPTEDKTWAISLLNRYEIHTENSDLEITPGHSYTLEWGISKSLRKTIDVGVIGYYQQQITDDDGDGVFYNTDIHPRVLAVGPEISMFCPKLGLFTSLRYAYEFEAEARPEGHTVSVTFTKRW